MAPDEIVVCDDTRGMRSLLALLPSSPALRAAALLLAEQRRILLCTGFPVDGHPETDGPAGAIALATALRSLQRPVVVVSWADALTAMEPDLGGLPCEEIQRGKSSKKIEGAPFTIEVCGRDAGNAYFNMKGSDITNACPWFEDAVGTHALVSICDGGNEYGMGSAPPQWYENRSMQRPTATCDALVVGQVSNWAALAVVAALSVQTRSNLLPSPTDYQQLLADLASRGMVDGVTRAQQPTEDGFDSAKSGTVLRSLHTWVANFNHTPPPSATCVERKTGMTRIGYIVTV